MQGATTPLPPGTATFAHGSVPKTAPMEPVASEMVKVKSVTTAAAAARKSGPQPPDGTKKMLRTPRLPLRSLPRVGTMWMHYWRAILPMILMVLSSSSSILSSSGLVVAAAAEASATTTAKKGSKKVLVDEMKHSLLKRLPSIFLDEFDIVISLEDPDNVSMDPANTLQKNKKTILWVLDDVDHISDIFLENQNADSAAAAVVASLERFAKIIFLSSTQQQRYQDSVVAAHAGTGAAPDRAMHLLQSKSMVMKPAVEPLLQQQKQSGQKEETAAAEKSLRIVYLQTSTAPHSSLQQLVLPAFLRTLSPKHGASVQLHVFVFDDDNDSSDAVQKNDTKDCGYDMNGTATTTALCTSHPSCHYHSSALNNSRKGMQATSLTIRTILQNDADILVVPRAFSGERENTPLLASVVLEAMGAGVEVVHASVGTLKELMQPGMGVAYHHPPEQEQQAQALANFAKSIDKAIVSYAQPHAVERRRKCQLAVASLHTWGIYGSGTGQIEEWAKLLTSLLPQTEKYLAPARSLFLHNDTDRAYSEALFVAARKAEVTDGNLQQAFLQYRACVQLEEQRSKSTIEISFVSTMALSNLAYLGGNRFNQPSMVDEAISSFTRLLQTVDQPWSPLESEHSDVYYQMAMKVAMHHLVHFEYSAAREWFDKLHTSRSVHDDCADLTRATLVPHLPTTTIEHDSHVQRFHTLVDSLLAEDHPVFCMDALSAMYMGFPLAYYDLNFREPQEKWVTLYLKADPKARYWSPNLRWTEEKLRIQEKDYSQRQPLKVGIVCSNFQRDHSNWASFGRTLNYLQLKRSEIQVDFIYYNHGRPVPFQDKQLSTNPETNIYLEDMRGGQISNLFRNRKMVEEQEFDLLLFIDLWLCPEMFHLASSKLAPIQLNTYGHPTTSGLPRTVMDYYLSWGMAEQANRTEAQSFYTEELYLVGETTPWEIFERRTNDDGTSVKGYRFSHYTKTNLDFYPSEEARQKMTKKGAKWYFCSQNLFKFGVPFDSVLGSIQKEDPNALIILVGMTQDANNQRLDPIALKRMSNKRGGVDLDRVIIMPRMPHWHLMAMYNVSDVILDPYYFGGCTTSREAMEVGAPIINLPHRTVGQRFTQAYQRIIGVTDFIAKDLDDYIRLAVEVANMETEKRAILRERIRKAALSELFEREDAGELWGDAFIDIASRPRNWRWVDEQVVEPFPPKKAREIKAEL